MYKKENTIITINLSDLVYTTPAFINSRNYHVLNRDTMETYHKLEMP